jgi:hypothetical protein
MAAILLSVLCAGRDGRLIKGFLDFGVVDWDTASLKVVNGWICTYKVICIYEICNQMNMYVAVLYYELFMHWGFLTCSTSSGTVEPKGSRE